MCGATRVVAPTRLRVNLLPVKIMAESKSKSFCSVPQCSNSKQKQPYLCFHDFPSNKEQREKWVIAIRREEGPFFVIRRGSTYVCSQHFTAADYIEGRSRLKVGVVPSRFKWNDLHVTSQSLSASEGCRVRLGVEARAQEPPVVLEDSLRDHDYVARASAGKHVC